MNYREKIDFSSLSTYLDCPRKFLFQYLLHLRSSRKSIHLVFGSCWHYGLEVVYKQLQSDPDSLTVIDATELSIVSFNDLWKIEGEPYFPDQDMIFPKSPGHAANMYNKYWQQFLDYDQQNKTIIAVEDPFVINLSNFADNLPNYIGRQDLIFKNNNDSLEIVDHKTAKALYPTTLTGFEMSFQTDGYLTSGHMYYDKIPTMTYSIALCQKSKIAFQRFNIIKTKSAVEQFLNDLVFYSSDIIKNLDVMEYELTVCKDRNSFINCFRRQAGYACTVYMSNCPYLDLCKIRNNPLLWKDNPPQGYAINEWNPEEHEAEMKRNLKEVA